MALLAFYSPQGFLGCVQSSSHIKQKVKLANGTILPQLWTNTWMVPTLADYHKLREHFSEKHGSWFPWDSPLAKLPIANGKPLKWISVLKFFDTDAHETTIIAKDGWVLGILTIKTPSSGLKRIRSWLPYPKPVKVASLETDAKIISLSELRSLLWFDLNPVFLEDDIKHYRDNLSTLIWEHGHWAMEVTFRFNGQYPTISFNPVNRNHTNKTIRKNEYFSNKTFLAVRCLSDDQIDWGIRANFMLWEKIMQMPEMHDPNFTSTLSFRSESWKSLPSFAEPMPIPYTALRETESL